MTLLVFIHVANQSNDLHFFSELPHFITKPPPSVTVRVEHNLTLHFKATGFPPPIVTWYKDGQVIEEEKRHFKKRKLEIKEIQFEDRGLYTCTAENLLGRVQLLVNVTVKGKKMINSTAR